MPAPSPPAAANNTWWNIYSSRGATLYLPDCDFGPILNYVGRYGPPEICERPGKCRNDGDEGGVAGASLASYCPNMAWYVEQAERELQLFAPRDLHAAMVKTRWDRLR